MQRNSAVWGKLSGWRNFTAVLSVVSLIGTGCPSDNSSTPPPKPAMPFAGVQLRIACSDAVVGEALSGRAAAWSRKNGTTVRLEARSSDADVVIIRPVELGEWVSRNDARPVSDELREATQPIQWSRLLAVESERLASWAGQPRAVPLAGEAYVVLYRDDHFTDQKTAAAFRQKHSRQLGPPSTWDEYAEIAEFFADRGQPSLPPLSQDAGGVLREFHLIAACYERQAVGGTTLLSQTKETSAFDTPVAQMLAFHHDLGTTQPRLTKPAFVEAAKWLRRVARCRMKPGATDSIAAVTSGSAVMAVLSLRELGRLPKDGGAVSQMFGVAPLPGTRQWFDPKTGQPKMATNADTGNFVPYFGAEGWLGIVREGCANPAAAFDLLADLSRLERSTELLSDPALGFGPFRVEHLDQTHETIWQRYGFDGKRSRQLADAIRHYAAVGLANPVVGARGSDQAKLMTILAGELTPVVAGTGSPEAALAATEAAWRKVDAGRPPDAVQSERRQSAGLR